MKKIKNFLTVESGQATVLVAAFMIVLLGFAALSVDVGNVYLEKSKMQKSLDAAVLAGAQLLKTENNEDAAEVKAAEISNKNGFPLTVDTEVIAPFGDHYIRATKRKEVDMYFAKVLGINTMPVEASAKAVIRPIGGIKGLIPVGIAIDDLPAKEERYIKSVTLAFPPGSGKPAPGNFGFLDLDGHHGGGTPDLENRILNGYDGKVSVNDQIFTETGGATPAFRAFKERIRKDVGITKCQRADTADSSCNRLVIIPIIDEWVNGQGKPVKVVGFAAFFLEDLEERESRSNGNNSNNNGNGNGNETEKQVKGIFVKNLTQADLEEEFDPTKDYGLYVVKLTE